MLISKHIPAQTNTYICKFICINYELKCVYVRLHSCTFNHALNPTLLFAIQAAKSQQTRIFQLNAYVCLLTP